MYTKFLSYIILFFFMVLVQPALATIRYVSPLSLGSRNGSSWSNASSDLQAMINASASGDEIWVAGGTYTPFYDLFGNLNPSNGRDRAFRLRSGVRIYGGFVGNETSLASRNGLTTTILSGNVGFTPSTADNAFHVVVGYNITGAVLDQITIRDGNADGSGSVNLDGQSILRNWGGGIYCVLAGITINNCFITANNASAQGGGLYIRQSSNAQVTNSQFQRNTSLEGAGIMNSEEANTTYTNCIINENQGSDGAGFYSLLASPTLSNCLILQNTASNFGGGSFNQGGALSFQQCVWWGNQSLRGGGHYMNGGGNTYTNCTIARNFATFIGGAIFFNNISNGANILNSVIWGNNTTVLDANIANFSGSFANIAYSYCTIEGPSYGSGGPINNTNPQFLNIGDGDGADGFWRTADDGLTLTGCSPAIDAGNNASFTGTTDFAGQPRRNDVGFIANAGAGTAPIIDMGAYESQANIPVAQIIGQIGNPHTIPRRRELFPDFVTSVVDPVAPGVTISWQKSEWINGAWTAYVAATPQQNTPAYTLIDSVYPNTIRYRRVSNLCGTNFFTDPVQIKVVVPNGALAGRVISKNGTAVKGITITVKKTTDIMGSPASHVYDTTTGDDGTFLIQNIYYGDPDPNIGGTTNFEIRPSKPTHGFDPSVLFRSLSPSLPTNQLNLANFQDTTVFSVTGRTIQTCADCNNVTSGQVETQNCPIDSVEMYRNNQFFMRTTFLDPPGGFGLWANSVSDPGTYRYEPRFRNHQFSPAFINQPVSSNVTGVNFTDTTTRLISGRLTAGCNEFIGTAVLEFYDLLPNDREGNPRPSCFRKRVTTQPVTGYYEIRLPARRYQVRVVSFNAAGNVTNLDLLDFFNNRLSKDSLTRDITTDNALLNMVYERPPVISIVGLENACTPGAYAIIPQAIERSFTFQVRQGNTACPAIGDSIILNTNIQVDDINERLAFAVTNGNAQVTLKGGVPNIIGPEFLKTFSAIFKDRFGRADAVLNRKVVVTGVKANTATFTTVSPEIPLMILHDPPGDNSFSFWESSRTSETTLTMFAGISASRNDWAEVKIGTEFEAGLGVSTTTSVWGSIRGSVSVGSQLRGGTETVLTNTTTRNFSTSNNQNVIGSRGDVFIGAALNLIYSVANEVSYTAPCGLSLQKKLIVANKGFQTEYIYTEGHIRNNIIPTLKMFAESPSTTSARKREFANQIAVWEQVLNNNDENKKRASFDKNISFDGAAGEISSTTTTTASKRNTLEFGLSIDASVAAELGFEVGGSGASAGVEVAFKIETGGSLSNNVLNSTTIGYTLDDDDEEDFFSVDIKKDPVYNTPVFELVAGTTSCPFEEGSQPRDEMQLTIPEPVKNNVDPNIEADFDLILGNNSQSGETRDYELSFLQSSNPNGASIFIGGSPYVTPVKYTIGPGGSIPVRVKVRRPVGQVFSFEGLQFMLSGCDGSQSKIGSISVNFQSQCSAVALAVPENNWVVTQSENNLLPIIIKGYTLAGLTKVELEYSQQGTSNWARGFERTAAQLNNSINGTQVNWNVTDLPDGKYNLRLKLTCGFGVVYSQRSSGIIDRTPPVVFGKTNPTDDVYTTGDAIGIVYNEALDCSTINNNKVSLRRLSNGQLVNINVGCANNEIVLVPQDNIGNLTGDSMLVEITNLRDQYGNLRTTPDVWRFNIGQFTPATSGRALNLTVNNASINENSGQFIDYVFTLTQPAQQDIRINYQVSGNADASTDYSIQYVDTQKLNTRHSNSEGNITLFKNTSSTTLRLRPIGNSFFEPNKQIRLTLAEGGDYLLGTNVTAMGTIVNDDTPTTYTFTGNGNFSNAGNWTNGAKPPAELEEGNEIIINPGGNGECILDTRLIIKTGAKITVAPGKILRLVNGLQIKWN